MSSSNKEEEEKTQVPPRHEDDDDDSSEEEGAARTTTTNDNNPHRPTTGTTTSTTQSTLPLDWTKLGITDPSDQDNNNPPIRYPSDVADLDQTETELILVGTAGKKITHLGPDFYQLLNPDLQQLVLRSHMIKTMEGLEGLQHLVLLELYDNQVEALRCLNGGENGACGATLKTLDMSYNVIRDMQPVEYCPMLQELYLANNKLKSMAGLKGLQHLKKLDLGANRIRVMDPDELSGLVNLEELWLGKNKIEQIQGLENLTKLRRLDIQSNRITVVENLTSQAAVLEELYLAHNGIDDDGAFQPTGLALEFPQLSVLDMGRNQLTTTNAFGHLKSLDELWLSGNQIASFEQVQSLGSLGESLETIYLEYNDIQKDPLYRKKLANLMPSLKHIDAYPVSVLTVPAGVVSETEEQRLRRLQNVAVERAKAETQKKATIKSVDEKKKASIK